MSRRGTSSAARGRSSPSAPSLAGPGRGGRRAKRTRLPSPYSSRWAETARAELGRIAGRAAGEGLTPAELRVAELVARGSTNREVAAALFLAERTVETHLSHVYAKLGVRSRTELARVLR